MPIAECKHATTSLSGEAMTRIVDAYCVPNEEPGNGEGVPRLLALMDRAGIDHAVIAPDDREIAVANVEGNRRMERLSKNYPDRFIPACTINPWYGEAACRELTRAREAGARLLVLCPNLQGFYIGHPTASKLIRTAGDLDLPVYVHTGSHALGAPSQLVLAAAKYPATKFVMGHCGSTDYAYDMLAILRSAPENLWFELSLVRPWVIPDYIAGGDRTRFLFGSFAPRNDPALELRHCDASLPIFEYPDVYGDNLARLIGMERA